MTGMLQDLAAARARSTATPTIIWICHRQPRPLTTLHHMVARAFQALTRNHHQRSHIPGRRLLRRMRTMPECPRIVRQPTSRSALRCLPPDSLHLWARLAKAKEMRRMLTSTVIRYPTYHALVMFSHTITSIMSTPPWRTISHHLRPFRSWLTTKATRRRSLRA